MTTFRLLLTGSLALLSICIIPVSAAAAQVDAIAAKAVAARGATDMAEFIRLYETDRNSVGRFYELPWSDTRRERMEKLTRDWQERLQAVDFDKLDQPGRVDWILLRNKLASELARLDLERRRLAEMEEFLPFRKVIQDLEQARWRMEPVDAPKAAGAVSVIPDQIKKLRKRIEKGRKDDAKKEKPAEGSPGLADKPTTDAPLKISPSLARRAAAAVGELRGSLKGWASFYDGFLPEFSWWLKKPDEAAFSALDDYAKFLREEIAGLKGGDDEPLLGDPIGTDALADDIAAEMLPYSAEDLLAIGEAEFAWCEARMKEAAKEMGFGDDWKAALAKVKTGGQ